MYSDEGTAASDSEVVRVGSNTSVHSIMIRAQYMVLTIWRDDSMLPGVTSVPLFPKVPVSVATNGVSVSVCSKSVVWLLNSYVILGTGVPTDLQEMSALPPSGITTVEML